MSTPIPSNTPTFSVAEIVQATGGTSRAAPSIEVAGVAIDSRAVTEGSLFVAVRGAQRDGAAYLESARDAGAALALVHAGTEVPEGLAYIEVADTTVALGALARAHRRRWGKPVVAITGSAGKTTTKELTAAALSADGARVLKTAGNLNNQFGVPMMLFCLRDEHDVAVLEIGTSQRGEIEALGRVVEPDVAVVLLAAAAHTEGIGTVEDVADEKASLWHTLGTSGTAVVNADDENLMARTRSDVATIRFGRSEGADVRLLSVELALSGTEVRLEVDGRAHQVELSLIGDAAALDALAALAAVLALRGRGALDSALLGLSRARPTPGRMALSRTPKGLVLLDDSYNANPSSIELALRSLASLAQKGGVRSIAVLGDMKELGDLSQAEHTRMGELAVRLGIDVLIGCGREMAHATSQAARLAAGRLAAHPTRVAHVQDCAHAGPLLRSMSRPGDVVLIKGSRSMRMERLVAELAGAA